MLKVNFPLQRQRHCCLHDLHRSLFTASFTYSHHNNHFKETKILAMTMYMTSVCVVLRLLVIGLFKYEH